MIQRRLPVGAEVRGALTSFRVWAPASRAVDVVIEDGSTPRRHALSPAADGYFEGETAAPAGTRYRFALDDGERYPDPASRFQPEGPHGPSEVIDPGAFAWSDAGWKGLTPTGLVLYEMHVGTFTTQGSWRAAADHLPELARLGVTAIEIMPIADFAGQFGWGYDGVDLFAPTRLYGRPDDLRAFVDRAHALGLGVVLDVVYNHLGPDGCWLDRFSPHYFADTTTDWGRAINFDGPESRHVRTFFESNAAYWIDDFHIDGLRLDATQQIFDRSTPHILQTIVDTARATARDRAVWIVAENEPQHARLARPATSGGYGLDALWNDDFHHTAIVAATGQREAYYTDYLGSPAEFVACAAHGFLYQGQWYSWQQRPRGTSTAGLLPRAFVCFLENHDQVANSIAGARLHTLTLPGRYRALMTLLLAGPWTPMLFQGQEFSASTPFLYFADHHGTLGESVHTGRREFLKQFPSVVAAMPSRPLDEPNAVATFRRCCLNDDERRGPSPMRALTRSVLALRRSDPVLSSQGAHGVAGAVLGSHVGVIRMYGPGGSSDHDDRLLVFNLGEERRFESLPEPLLAPTRGRAAWTLAWSSEDEAFGGQGSGRFSCDREWVVPTESAWILT